MAFYDLPKTEREKLAKSIYDWLLSDLKLERNGNFITYFGDSDTYIRKCAYLAVGKLFKADNSLLSILIKTLNNMLQSPNYHIRQTAINAAGEIGILNFDLVKDFMDTGLFDEHHSVRNAVIGSIKKNGRKKILNQFWLGPKNT